MDNNALEQRLSRIALARERLGAITGAVTDASVQPARNPVAAAQVAAPVCTSMERLVAATLADFAGEAIAQIDSTVRRLRAMQAVAGGGAAGTKAPEPADVVDVEAKPVTEQSDADIEDGDTAEGRE